jgi:hypothetical protein
VGRQLIFLNSHRAKSGKVDEQELPEEFILLAKFFGCGPLDRTGELDMGLDYRVLQDIPEERTKDSFHEVCREVADGIVDRAVAEDKEIQVTWSGGIDSTVALLSLKERLQARGELDRFFVLMSLRSMTEYPRFYEHFIMGKLQTRALPVPLPKALTDDIITVTGEHGDQLFGSDHLAALVKGGVAHLPYREVIPFYITSKLKLEKRALRVMEYLEPQIRLAPTKIETAFDYLWWCNYSLKWQQVGLRMLAFQGGQVRGLYDNLVHFFGHRRFQEWSLSNPQVRKVRDWRAYKLQAKQVILEATSDFDYFTNKEKEPSLKHVLVDRAAQGRDRYRVHMYDDFEVHFEVFDKSERPK